MAETVNGKRPGLENGIPIDKDPAPGSEDYVFSLGEQCVEFPTIGSLAIGLWMGGTSRLEVDVAVPNSPALVGTSMFFQAYITDLDYTNSIPGGFEGSWTGLTDAVELRFGN